MIGPAPIQLMTDPLRLPVERLVSEHLGRQWTIQEARDMADYACHPTAILSDGIDSVFAKFSPAGNGREQFEVELAGLRLLSGRAGVLIPTPIGIVPAAGGSILVLEAVPAVERGPCQWRQIGQALARIHRVRGERFGLERNGFFGPLPQDNTPADDWPTFYVERRLCPLLRMAVDSGNLPHEFVPRLEGVIRRVPELCGPAVVPTLIHGDAQKNNYISSAAGAVVIDPAVYFGHPEMDLAFIDIFQPVPGEVFAAYHQELPIDPGFWERRPLWRICGYLGGVTVEGAGYLDMLGETLKRIETMT